MTHHYLNRNEREQIVRWKTICSVEPVPNREWVLEHN